MAQQSSGHRSGPNPRRVRGLTELARELDLLRARAAAGTMKAKVSLEDLARLVRLPRSTLHSYLSAQTLVPSEVLDRIVLALGADPVEQREWNEAWYRVHAGDHGQPRATGAEPAGVPFGLPPVVRGFTGRAAQLADLDSLLDTALRADGGAGLVIAAVSGTPGVGKTALALRWAHRTRHRFPDGCLYVDLRGYDPGQPLDAGQALAALLAGLAPGEEVPADPAVRAARYRSLLDGRRMLILLDNALCAEHVRPLLPGTGSCMVVVTSRDDLAGLVARDGAYRVDLDVLPLPDALALLGTLLGADRVVAGPRAATVLAQRCGRLPLALRVAAEIAASRPAASLADIADITAEADERSLDWLDACGDSRTDIRAVFSWSYRHLAASDPEAARVFRLLGSQENTDFTLTAVASLSGIAHNQARRLVGTLVRAHLVEPSTIAVGHFRMHGLLHAYAAGLAADT